VSDTSLTVEAVKVVVAAQPAEIAQRSRALATVYLDIVRDGDAERPLDTRSLFRGYWEFVRACLSLLILPVWAILNACHWLLRRRGFMKNRFLEDLHYVWRRIRHGEPPFPPIVTLGFFTRLFVMTHLTRRLDILYDSLRQQDLRGRLERESASTGSETSLQPVLTEIALFRTILKKRSGFKGATLVTSLTGSLLSFAGTLGLTAIIKTKSAAVLKDVHGVAGLFALPVVVTVVAMLFQIILITTVIVVSCFIRKRELLLQRDAFAQEHLAFDSLGRSRPREFPLDLFASLVIVVAYIATAVVQFILIARSFSQFARMSGETASKAFVPESYFIHLMLAEIIVMSVLSLSTICAAWYWRIQHDQR